MTSVIEFNVVILGAGPAGVSAAIQCLNKGLSVAIVERASFPRFRPGESLHAGVLPVLEQLGIKKQFLAAGFQEFDGVWAVQNGIEEKHYLGDTPYDQWVGYQVPREDFDRLLLDRALALGAVLFQPLPARSIIVEDRQVAGVKTEAHDIRSNYLIDGCGSSHWCARRLGLEIKQHSPPIIVEYGYERDCPYLDSELPRFQNDPSAWSWRAKIKNEHYAWVRTHVDGTKGSWRISSSKVCRADVTWRLVERPAGAGYVLAGDAACVTDPSTSHGVLRALLSGIMAATYVTKSFESVSQQELLAREYSEWIRGWFMRDLQVRNSILNNSLSAVSLGE